MDWWRCSHVRSQRTLRRYLICPFATSAANGLSGCAPGPNAGLGDYRPVSLAQRAALRVGRGGSEPDPGRRAPGPTLLALVTSPCGCSCPMVSACDTGGALWLACGPASLCCPGYERPHALRADPGLPRVSWPGDPFSVAGHACSIRSVPSCPQVR